MLCHTLFQVYWEFCSGLYFVFLPLFYWLWNSVEVSTCNWEFVYLSIQFYYFFSHIFWSFILDTYTIRVSMCSLTIDHYVMTLFILVTFLILKANILLYTQAFLPLALYGIFLTTCFFFLLYHLFKMISLRIIYSLALLFSQSDLFLF